MNVWWKHKADFIPSDCDMEPNQTLDNFKFTALEKEDSSDETPEDLMWVVCVFFFLSKIVIPLFLQCVY